MKKIRKRKIEPILLREYREKYPQGTWDNFHRKCSKGYRQVKQALIEDQNGLCAYCETKIVKARYDGQVDDFRVEHFYPKAGTETSQHNYHLDWRNLLGVCHGGSQPLVVESAARYSLDKRGRSCDVLKGNKRITGVILNPLTLPVSRIWCFGESDGMMYVDYRSCPDDLVDKAENTIVELNLNASRLCRMRKAVIEQIADSLTEMVAAGNGIDLAIEELAGIWLKPDASGECLPYYSTIRWYLGDGAEKAIREGRK